MKLFLVSLLLVSLGFCNGNTVSYNPPVTREPQPTVVMTATETPLPPPTYTPTNTLPTIEPPPTTTPQPTPSWQPPLTSEPPVTQVPTQEATVIVNNIPVNQNPYFNDAGVTHNYSSRIQDVPNGWNYVANVGSVDLHPFVFRRSFGYRFETSYLNGWFGLSQNVQLSANQLYLVKVTYTEELSLTQGTYEQNPIYFSGFVTGSTTQTLPISNINIDSGGQILESLWVIRPTTNFLATIEVWFYTLYPSYAGALNIRSIEIIPVPSNYTNSFIEVN
jgi:hypothetical protein